MLYSIITFPVRYPKRLCYIILTRVLPTFYNDIVFFLSQLFYSTRFPFFFNFILFIFKIMIFFVHHFIKLIFIFFDRVGKFNYYFITISLYIIFITPVVFIAKILIYICLYTIRFFTTFIYFCIFSYNRFIAFLIRLVDFVLYILYFYKILVWFVSKYRSDPLFHFRVNEIVKLYHSNFMKLQVGAMDLTKFDHLFKNKDLGIDPYNFYNIELEEFLHGQVCNAIERANTITGLRLYNYVNDTAGLNIYNASSKNLYSKEFYTFSIVKGIYLQKEDELNDPYRNLRYVPNTFKRVNFGTPVELRYIFIFHIMSKRFYYTTNYYSNIFSSSVRFAPIDSYFRKYYLKTFVLDPLFIPNWFEIEYSDLSTFQTYYYEYPSNYGKAFGYQNANIYASESIVPEVDPVGTESEDDGDPGYFIIFLEPDSIDEDEIGSHNEFYKGFHYTYFLDSPMRFGKYSEILNPKGLNRFWYFKLLTAGLVNFTSLIRKVQFRIFLSLSMNYIIMALTVSLGLFISTALFFRDLAVYLIIRGLQFFYFLISKFLKQMKLKIFSSKTYRTVVSFFRACINQDYVICLYLLCVLKIPYSFGYLLRVLAYTITILLYYIFFDPFLQFWFSFKKKLAKFIELGFERFFQEEAQMILSLCKKELVIFKELLLETFKYA